MRRPMIQEGVRARARGCVICHMLGKETQKDRREENRSDSKEGMREVLS